eukprot:CAMPEP_0119556170 /NCGR_PEP_ID=MMETSP1352-20130426/8195_1 /TAXON_ID=265584 /ORGANISM="Stauroneis constricta, Strain CCMP1120" /LENGTH=187 /DNA_ID=CAMNT_0007603073 /DNA_START=58 /DNA_END=621 /DNA_ORIENTATION=-
MALCFSVHAAPTESPSDAPVVQSHSSKFPVSSALTQHLCGTLYANAVTGFECKDSSCTKESVPVEYTKILPELLSEIANCRSLESSSRNVAADPKEFFVRSIEVTSKVDTSYTLMVPSFPIDATVSSEGSTQSEITGPMCAVNDFTNSKHGVNVSSFLLGSGFSFASMTVEVRFQNLTTPSVHAVMT